MPEDNRGESATGTFLRAMRILQCVADAGGASAKDIAARCDIPLPTVYRLLRMLVEEDFLAHLSSEHRYELGFKVHHLATSLHRQLGVPPAVRAQVRTLHRTLDVASYWTVYRGTDVVVAYVADAPSAPRVRTLDIGPHQGAHATAFGKVMLSGMEPPQRAEYLESHKLVGLTPKTITDRAELETHLASIAEAGMAWEFEEFQTGLVCAATPVRYTDGRVLGSVAVSGGVELAQRVTMVERALRQAAADVGRHLRRPGTSR